jgi:hypothetical protein
MAHRIGIDQKTSKSEFRITAFEVVFFARVKLNLIRRNCFWSVVSLRQENIHHHDARLLQLTTTNNSLNCAVC